MIFALSLSYAVFLVGFGGGEVLSSKRSCCIKGNLKKNHLGLGGV